MTAETAVVVATQGEDDEGALEEALRTESRDVAFVASAKKWQAVSDHLRERGVPEDRIRAVKAPAGLDIGAVSPEEIAVSILAQIIEARRKSQPSVMPKLAVPEPPAVRDPICGMTVNPATTRYSSDHGGRTIYFCCAHCKTTFDKNPGRHA